jgi:hypothetical protein
MEPSKGHVLTGEQKGPQWPYSLPETLVFVVLVAATVELGNTFGFFYGLAFGIGAGAIAGLINKRSKERRRSG